MKLFLAGANCKTWCESIYLSNHPNYLTTYFEHQEGFSDKWLYWYKKTSKKGASWIMDSGLFTMMFGVGKDKTYTEQDLLDYTFKYLNDVKKINYNHYIVEMDVHKVLGLDSLKRFRKIFESRYDIEKTIYVFHIEEGEKGFKELCKKYPYIAISIPELRIVLKGKNKLEKAVRELILIANKINPNIKIHLLGCTQQNLMEQKGYYSCDSTSWLSAGRYGNGYIFNGQKLQQLSIHTKAWEQYIEKHNKDIYIHREELLDKPYYKNIIMSGKAFNQLNKHINNIYYNHEPLKQMI